MCFILIIILNNCLLTCIIIVNLAKNTLTLIPSAFTLPSELFYQIQLCKFFQLDYITNNKKCLQLICFLYSTVNLLKITNKHLDK